MKEQAGSLRWQHQRCLLWIRAMTLGVDCAFDVVPRVFAFYLLNGIEHNKFIGLPSCALRRGRRVPEALLCVSTRLLL